MYFPYFHKTTIDYLYDVFTNYQSSEDKELRRYFYSLKNYSWRLIINDPLITAKITFYNFADLFSFIKFAYITYPSVEVKLLYFSK